jgi:hypothetical protein
MATEKQKVMVNLAEVEPWAARLTIESDCETLDVLGPSVHLVNVDGSSQNERVDLDTAFVELIERIDFDWP